MDILVAIFAYIFRVGPMRCQINGTLSFSFSLSLFFWFLFILSDKGRLFGELMIVNMGREVFLLSWPFFIRSQFLMVRGICNCVHRFFDGLCENKNLTFLRYLYPMTIYFWRDLTRNCPVPLVLFSLSSFFFLPIVCLFNLLFECTLIEPS